MALRARGGASERSPGQASFGQSKPLLERARAPKKSVIINLPSVWCTLQRNAWAPLLATLARLHGAGRDEEATPALQLHCSHRTRRLLHAGGLLDCTCAAAASPLFEQCSSSSEDEGRGFRCAPNQAGSSWASCRGRPASSKEVRHRPNLGVCQLASRARSALQPASITSWVLPTLRTASGSRPALAAARRATSPPTPHTSHAHANAFVPPIPPAGPPPTRAPPAAPCTRWRSWKRPPRRSCTASRRWAPSWRPNSPTCTPASRCSYDPSGAAILTRWWRSCGSGRRRRTA